MKNIAFGGGRWDNEYDADHGDGENSRDWLAQSGGNHFWFLSRPPHRQS